MAMDYTQALIDRTRQKAKYYPFNRPRFWLKFWFDFVIFLLAAWLVVYLARFVFTHRAELHEILNRL